MKKFQTFQKQETNSLSNVVNYFNLRQPNPIRFITHRKIPSSKYRGRFIVFFEDDFNITRDLQTEEDIEPP